jgi:hypothetical protein
VIGSLILAATVGGTVWLVRSRWLAFRVLGWALAVMLALFGGLIMLTLDSPIIIDPDLFAPQDKWPDGGLEVAVRPMALEDVEV